MDTPTNQAAAEEQLVMLLGDLMESLVAADSQPMDFDTGHILHRAEIHAIAAIGRQNGLNLTQLAEDLGVTKGAASQMISRLIKKGLVSKTPAPETRREVVLELSERGWRGYRAHQELHARMVAAVHGYYGPQNGARVGQAIHVLRDLIALVEVYRRKQAE